MKEKILEELFRSLEVGALDGEMLAALFLAFLSKNNAWGIRCEIEGIKKSDVAIMPMPGCLHDEVKAFIESRMEELEGLECKDENVH